MFPDHGYISVSEGIKLGQQGDGYVIQTRDAAYAFTRAEILELMDVIDLWRESPKMDYVARQRHVLHYPEVLNIVISLQDGIYTITALPRGGDTDVWCGKGATLDDAQENLIKDLSKIV